MTDVKNTCMSCLSCFVTLPMQIFGGVMLYYGGNAIAQGNEVGGCVSAPGLPVLLVLGGIILVIGLVLRHFISKGCDSCTSGLDNCQIGGNLCKCGAVVMYDLFLISLSTVWLVAGIIVFASNEDLKTTTNDSAQVGPGWVCSADVYNMTVLSMVACAVVIVLAFLFLVIGRLCANLLCCKACKTSTEGGVNA